jgi:hypothetical protein
LLGLQNDYATLMGNRAIARLSIAGRFNDRAFRFRNGN